jgi:cysteinyl-tRNA synthetase
MDLVIALRAQAKTNKDWPTADLIRQQLTQMGIVLKDTKEGSEWTIEK